MAHKVPFQPFGPLLMPTSYIPYHNKNTSGFISRNGVPIALNHTADRLFNAPYREET